MALRAALSHNFPRRASSLAWPNALRSLSSRELSTATESPAVGNRRFVRIAGPSHYASIADMTLFLERNGVQLPESVVTASKCSIDDAPFPVLLQGQSDVFQNHSIWLYDAGTQEQAVDVASKLSGKVVGMKLVRSAAIDIRLLKEFVGSSRSRGRIMLRQRLSVIAPSPEERGRTILATGLESNLVPRFLWGFFSAFDVEDIRMLRRSGVACVVFNSPEEAHRAIRERYNSLILNRHPAQLKMYS